MEKDMDFLRGLLVEIFVNKEPNDLVSRLFEYEDTYIHSAYVLQNKVLNDSISTLDENSEARLSHLEFYYGFNKWYLEFAERNTIIVGEKK